MRELTFLCLFILILIHNILHGLHLLSETLSLSSWPLAAITLLRVCFWSLANVQYFALTDGSLG